MAIKEVIQDIAATYPEYRKLRTVNKNDLGIRAGRKTIPCGY